MALTTKKLRCIRLIIAGLISAAVMICTSATGADVLVLKSGKEITGKISKGPQAVSVQTEDGQIEMFDLSEVKGIKHVTSKKVSSSADAAVPAQPAQSEQAQVAQPEQSSETAIGSTEEVVSDFELITQENQGFWGGIRAKLNLIGAARHTEVMFWIGFVAWLIGKLMISRAVFSDSFLRGMVCLLVDPYTFYCCFFEYHKESKWVGRTLYVVGVILIITAQVMIANADPLDAVVIPV